MGSELAVIEGQAQLQNVSEVMRRATDVAGVCREIVLKTAKKIGDRQYVRVEGWQSIAATYGCVASTRDVETIEGGVRAFCDLRRMSDGAVVATAEGFVGDDEELWAKRTFHARRAMAQTRAISRACRSAFAFVVVLIDSGLSTTPAEEMDGVNDDTKVKAAPPRGAAALKASLAPVAKASPPKARKLQIQEVEGPPPHDDSHAPVDAEWAPAGGEEPRMHEDISFGFGRDKDKPISVLDESSLRWYEGICRKDLADSGKAQWHAKTTQQLACIQAELRWRGLA